MKTRLRIVLGFSLSTVFVIPAQAAVITVTGGSAAAITNALATSSAGDIIEIADNLTYDFSAYIAGYAPVHVTNRTLRAAAGFTPTIYADPTPAGGVFTVFRVGGDATNPGTIQGLKFESGPTAWLNQYIQVYFSKYVNILDNDFALQNLERNWNSGRAIMIEGSSATGPTILMDGNLFHTTASSSFNAPYAVYTDGGASGFIARNNVIDMSGRTNGDVYGFYLRNEGSYNSTTIINNTLVFANLASATNVGVSIVTNAMVTGAIQNNIFLNADIGYQDLYTGTGSTLTFNYNLFDNVGQIYSAQLSDVITTNNNISGVGIAMLGTPYSPYFLQSGSLAIDAGLNGLSYGAYDFTNGQRVWGSFVDMGALEWHMPEPSMIVLLGLGGGLWRWRRRKH